MSGYAMSVTSNGQVSEESIGSPLRPWTSEPWHASQEGAFNACQHFLDCLKRGVPADTSGEDNLKTFALAGVVEAAYKAAEEKRAVEPESWRRKA